MSKVVDKLIFKLYLQVNCLQVCKFCWIEPRLKGGSDVDGGTPLEIIKVKYASHNVHLSLRLT